jgi:hypothetical protein
MKQPPLALLQRRNGPRIARALTSGDRMKLKQGKWYHIVTFVPRSGRPRLYVNGIYQNWWRRLLCRVGLKRIVRWYDWRKLKDSIG